jgi:hypothetical protein
LLIQVGKTTPFLLVFVLLVGYIENIYSILTNRIAIDDYGLMFYYCPVGMWLSDVIYIDWFDVLLVWILCFALELCKYSFRCAYLITLNLPFRWLVGHVSMPDGIVIGFYVFMALAGLYCIYGGLKILFNSRK